MTFLRSLKPGLRSLKPGWYLLLLLLIYAVATTAALTRANARLREERLARVERESAAPTPEPVTDPAATPTAAPTAESTESTESTEPTDGAPATAQTTASTTGGAFPTGTTADPAGAASAAGEAASADAAATPPASAGVATGLWFPLPGASLPRDDAKLPGAPRGYRQGVLQGFDFYGDDAGIPVPYGAPVIASAAGTLLRVDHDYREPDRAAWQQLLQEVADGADEAQLDRLRGRQIWLRLDDGRVLRYAHLAGIRDGLQEGQRVYRGQVLGFVGNSGTDDGVAGTTHGARLHFQVWQGERFFGQELEPDAVRAAAAELFSGP